MDGIVYRGYDRHMKKGTLTNEIMETIYSNFETVCIQENAEVIENFIKKFDIDV